MPPHVIGIDIGTQSTKALVLDGQGRIIASHQQGYRVDTPQPRWAEQWPDVWWQAVVACIKGCLASKDVEPASIQALCISSLYGGSGIPVDEAMEPLHPCLIWMDRRAEPQVNWVRQHVDLARLEAVTGNGVDSYYGFTKMMWLKQERPDIWARTRYLVPPNNYMTWRLTGELAVDHSSAGNIGGIYDLVGRCWSDEMTTALGLDIDKLPPRLVDSGDAVGSLDAVMAEMLGLPEGIAVVAGGVDAAMATLAGGATAPGHHVAMIGTSMCWGMINQRPTPGSGLISFPHVLNGERDIYTFGGALTAGASVAWYLDTFFADRNDHGDIYAELEALAAALPPGANRLLFLPYLMGERSPVWDAHASAAFVGLDFTHRREHMYRAVLEGVAYALRHNMQAGAAMQVELDPRLIIVGGVTQSDLWMQIIADITGHPVYTYRENVEAALGAGLLAASHQGLLSLDGGELHGTLIERATPTPNAKSTYDALFQCYCDLYPALQPLMHRLDGIDLPGEAT